MTVSGIMSAVQTATQLARTHIPAVKSLVTKDAPLTARKMVICIRLS